MAEISFDDLIPQSPHAGAISSIESGGRYDIVGPIIKSGSMAGQRALGKYQVMESNVGPWSKEVLGQEVTPQQFLADPKIQDAIFSGKFGQYAQKYGPEGAARAWFAGEGGMNDPNRRDQLGTTVAQYGAKFTAAGGSKPSAKEISFDDLIPGKTSTGFAGGFGGRAGREDDRPALVASSPSGYSETYHGMKNEGLNQLSRGVEQIRSGVNYATTPTPAGASPSAGVADLVKGVGNVAMGGIGYVASPINAGLRNFVGRPVQEATGIPAEYTDFAASLAIPGIGMTRIGSIPVQTQRTLTAGEKVAQAGQNLGNIGNTGAVQIPKAVTTDSTVTQRAASTVRNVPLAGDPLVNAADRTLTQLGQKSQDVAQAYGSGSALTAGDTAGTAIKSWITGESAATSKKFYDRVDALVNPSVTTDLTNARGAAQSILNRRANAGISEPSQAVRRIEDAVTRPGGLNYEGVKDLRTYIGELIDKPHLLPADISGKELERIYGALSKDLGASVKNAGGAKAQAAFDRANTHYRLVSERREALAKIVGADGKVPAERVFDNLVALASSGSRADIGRLAQARKVMGQDEWNEVASAAVARMGRSEDVGGSISSAGNIAFSPQKFLTAYQDKLSKPGRDLLFRSAGKESIAPYLDDIATISTRFKELQKFSNPSGTGQIGAGVGIGAGFMADPISTVTAVVGARVMAGALAQPTTVAPIVQWAKKYTVATQVPSPANIALLTIASRNLANTLNSKMGLSIAPEDFLRAIQGGKPSRADEQEPSIAGGVP